jgi:hypothetical protein
MRRESCRKETTKAVSERRKSRGIGAQQVNRLKHKVDLRRKKEISKKFDTSRSGEKRRDKKGEDSIANNKDKKKKTEMAWITESWLKKTSRETHSATSCPKIHHHRRRRRRHQNR